MLSFFRQKGLSNVLYGAIIVATIFTFVIEFRPNAANRTASLSEQCAARVRGRCIDPKDFASAYRILMPSRSAETSRRLNIKRVALDGLIERELLDDEAKRLGIGVTENEVTDELYAGYVRASVPSADPAVAQSILQEMYQSYARAGIVSQEVAQAHFNDRDTAIPVNFRDPKSKMFDIKVYERQVRNISNRSTAEFRAEQAREIVAAKMRDVIRAPIRISESEASQEYVRRYDTATVAWLSVKEAWIARWVTGANANQADIDAWVKDHTQDVEKEIADRQKQDAPKPGHLRHILVKLPYGATDDEKASTLAKLSWAVARIKAGESFAEVARDTSDDAGSGAMGGDLGDKTDGFVAPFKVAADALTAGESTAGAVETQFGYHFIMRDDPARASEIEGKVKRDVARSMYAKATTTDASKRIAAEILSSIGAGKAADDAIHDAIPGAARRSAKFERLRVLPPPPSADAGVAATTTPSADGGAGGKPSAPDALPVKTFDAATDGDRPQVQTSTAFNRGGDPFAGLSPDGTAMIVEFAFSSHEGDVLKNPVRMPDGFAVVQLKQRKTATHEDFEKDRETFVQELVRAKRDEGLSLYVRRLRDQAKNDIKVDDSFVQETKVDGGASGGSEDEDEY